MFHHGSMRLVAALCLVCLLPVSASAQERTPGLQAPTIAASVAAAADWASTYYALKNFRVREVNPLLRPLESSPGKLVTIGAVMDVAAFSMWNTTMGRNHPKIATAGMWAMAGFRAYLAIHNMRNTQKAARR
jgi:hypothetical protein